MSWPSSSLYYIMKLPLLSKKRWFNYMYLQTYFCLQYWSDCHSGCLPCHLGSIRVRMYSYRVNMSKLYLSSKVICVINKWINLNNANLIMIVIVVLFLYFRVYPVDDIQLDDMLHVIELWLHSLYVITISYFNLFILCASLYFNVNKPTCPFIHIIVIDSQCQ